MVEITENEKDNLKLLGLLLIELGTHFVMCVPPGVFGARENFVRPRIVRILK